MAKAKKGFPAKAVFARLLAALVAAAACGAVWAGQHYGLFSQLVPDQPSIPEGFIDENSTHAFVEFIDVGEGDAALIGSEGHYMLIDTGSPDDTDKLIRTLMEEGVTALDYLVLSHPHSDHIGEAAEIISRFDIGCVISPEVPQSLLPDTVSYDKLMETADKLHTDLRTAKDERFALGDTCTFETFVPKDTYDDLNDYSVFLRFTHGDNTFLFTGDSEQPEEEELVSRVADLSADVLKAGHHGGRDSCSLALLSAVKPKYTVVSCGKDNDYGHPNRDTLRRIEQFSVEIFVTAEDGNIRFESDGCRIKATKGYKYHKEQDKEKKETDTQWNSMTQ